MVDKKKKKGKFPKAPDWDKIEEVVKGALEHFDTMTYTEKYNVILLLKSTVDREFNVLTIVDFLSQMKESAENLDIEKVKGMGQYG